MSRSIRVTIILAVVGSTVSACAAPTAPTVRSSRITNPGVTGPSTDEITPDPNCRNGYNVTNGRAC
jgi:hypothetical protein